MLRDVEKYIPNQSPVLAKDMNTLGDVVRMLNNVSGPDVFVDPTGILFRRRPEPAVPFPIMIDGYTQDGTLKRWKYSWHRTTKLSAGYSTASDISGSKWDPVIGAVSGPSGSYGYAYNGAEENNGRGSSPTTYGNGVLVSALAAVPNLEIQPVTPGTIVLAFTVYLEGEGDVPEVWFTFPNGVSGAVLCP